MTTETMTRSVAPSTALTPTTPVLTLVELVRGDDPTLADLATTELTRRGLNPSRFTLRPEVAAMDRDARYELVCGDAKDAMNEDLMGLAVDPDPRVREAVAMLFGLDDEVCAVLATDPTMEVRAQLADNYWCPLILLLRLVNDHVQGGQVSYYAWQTLEHEHGLNPDEGVHLAELVLSMELDDRKTMAADPLTDDDYLGVLLLRDRAWEVRATAASNTNIDPSHLAELVERRDYAPVLEAAAENPRMPHEALVALVDIAENAINRGTDDNWDLMASVGRNTSCEPSLLARIVDPEAAWATDGESAIWVEVASNPSTPTDLLQLMRESAEVDALDAVETALSERGVELDD